MDNQELLLAMRQMLEETVAPINKRLDNMDKRLDNMDKRLDNMDKRLDNMDKRLDDLDRKVDEAKTLATKTQLTIENEIAPKIKILFEGQLVLQSRFAQIDRMERILEEVRSDVQTLKAVVSWHSTDIRALKRRSSGRI